jgi:hypothetical protein
MGDKPRSALEVVVDDSLILYEPLGEQSHMLNAGAAFIWHLLSDGWDPAAIAQEIEDRFPEVADAHRDVLAALSRFRAAGLLDDGSSARSLSNATDEQHAASVALPQPSELGSYSAVDHRFAIAAPPHLMPSILPTLRTLRSSLPPEHLYQVVMDSGERGTSRMATLLIDGRKVASVDDRSIGDTLFWHINHQACRAATNEVMVHASAVLTCSGVVAMAGRSNAGKSTLVTALTRSGYPYVTDESVPVDLVTGRVRAYPKPVGIDAGSQGLFPDVERSASSIARQRWWVSPLDLAIGAESAVNGSVHPLRAVVFIEYQAGRATSFEVVPPAQATFALTANQFNLAQHGQRALDSLAAIGSSVPCYRLIYGDLAEGVASFEAAFPAEERRRHANRPAGRGPAER